MSKQNKKIPKIIVDITPSKDIFELIDDFYIEHCFSNIRLPLTNATLDMLNIKVIGYRKNLMEHGKRLFNEDFSEVLIRWINGGLGYQKRVEDITKYLDYLQKLNMIDQMIYDYHVQLIKIRNR